MVMVELTHPSASIFLVFLEKGMFCVLKSFFEEELLVLIWPFCFYFAFFFNFFEDDFLILAKLLQFYIGKLSIIKELIEDDVEILVSGVFQGDRFHLIGQMLNAQGGLLIVKHREVLIALHLRNTCKQIIIKSLESSQRK